MDKNTNLIKTSSGIPLRPNFTSLSSKSQRPLLPNHPSSMQKVVDFSISSKASSTNSPLSQRRHIHNSLSHHKILSYSSLCTQKQTSVHSNRVFPEPGAQWSEKITDKKNLAGLQRFGNIHPIAFSTLASSSQQPLGIDTNFRSSQDNILSPPKSKAQRQSSPSRSASK